MKPRKFYLIQFILTAVASLLGNAAIANAQTISSLQGEAYILRDDLLFSIGSDSQIYDNDEIYVLSGELWIRSSDSCEAIMPANSIVKYQKTDCPNHPLRALNDDDYFKLVELSRSEDSALPSQPIAPLIIESPVLPETEAEILTETVLELESIEEPEAINEIESEAAKIDPFLEDSFSEISATVAAETITPSEDSNFILDSKTEAPQIDSPQIDSPETDSPETDSELSTYISPDNDSVDTIDNFPEFVEAPILVEPIEPKSLVIYENSFLETGLSIGGLSIGDQIDVVVDNVDELSTSYSVLDDGTVNFKLLGPISVMGLSLSELTKLVTDLYEKDYLNNPHIRLSLVEPSSLSQSPTEIESGTISETVSETVSETNPAETNNEDEGEWLSISELEAQIKADSEALSENPNP